MPTNVLASRRRKSWTAYLLVPAVAIGLTSSLAFIAGRVASPAQRASAAEPPQAAVLTVPVRLGPLRDSVVVRATTAFSSTRRITVSTAGSSGQPVVTKVPLKPGSQLQAGTLIAEISGEPLFALTSPFGPYRDLVTGAVGPDVEVVQDNLRRLGLPTGRTGKLDARTADGVRRLLRRMGYATPATPSSTQGPAVSEDQGSQGAVIVLPARYWLATSGPGQAVATIGLRVGQNLAEAPGFVEVASGDKVVRIEGATDEARRFQTGLRATFTPDTGKPVAGVLTAPPFPEPQAGAGDGPPAFLLPLPGLDALPAGTTGRLEVFVVATEPVLSVPVTALRTQPDGTIFVRVRRASGDIVDVPVRVGAQARGNVAISAPGLKRDDLVVLP